MTDVDPVVGDYCTECGCIVAGVGCHAIDCSQADYGLGEEERGDDA